MATVSPNADFRRAIEEHGGTSVGRCYQCATCSSVCDLASPEAPFPRRQMLWAQWGLVDKLERDPSVWLCHQCNDCTVRCPRNAKPGDVMQAARSLMVERMATPRFIGKLVNRAAVTWPILLALPIIYWVLMLNYTVGLNAPGDLHAYEQFVPHRFIYGTYFAATAFILFAVVSSSLKFWRLMGENAPRSGSFLGNLMPVLGEIATHKRFGKCGAASGRRWGHFFLVWGFVGAAVTSALLILAMYGMHEAMPLAQEHPFKLLGNISAVLLVLGVVMLLFNRLGDPEKAGGSSAFDVFFLGVVFMVVFTGVFAEVGRYIFDPGLACWIYLLHLSVVLCLFLTFPFSKFAHLVYRTLAMVHERMAQAAAQPAKTAEKTHREPVAQESE